MVGSKDMEQKLKKALKKREKKKEKSQREWQQRLEGVAEKKEQRLSKREVSKTLDRLSYILYLLYCLDVFYMDIDIMYMFVNLLAYGHICFYMQ